MTNLVDLKRNARGSASSPAGLTLPRLLRLAVRDELTFRPAPPGDGDLTDEMRLKLSGATVHIDLPRDDFEVIEECLASGALTAAQVDQAMALISAMPASLRDRVMAKVGEPSGESRAEHLANLHRLDRIGLIAVETIDRAHNALLEVEPLKEVHFRFSPHAKIALALGWLALSNRGTFPISPSGAENVAQVGTQPSGSMHFVSASDGDAGYLYTMGIALSAEAQAVGSTAVSFGLDGELIVPGQAVAPIPPTLALATRCFAAGIATSSNISEEVQSIPLRTFAHPTSMDDLEPRRGGRTVAARRPRDLDATLTDLRQQIDRFDRARAAARRRARLVGAMGGLEVEPSSPEVAGVLDVSGLTRWQMVDSLRDIVADPTICRHRERIALYLNLESSGPDRVGLISETIDAAEALGLQLVTITDDVEDSWLPGLLEYLEPGELNAIAEYADDHGILVLDARPVDPVYTAATAAQRIQSVYTTLSVDILKMGMWLCLDAMTARSVWREITSNPHIPAKMLLMPIGIVEPWCAFVDNRNPGRTARAINDPFEKIKFMIEEAELLGIPSLLTDTRHKTKWVLLGRKTDSDEPHTRERFVFNPDGERLGRTSDSAVPLLSWAEFMECERLARRAGVLLGQAGSIESDQAFRIISETTFDAALVGSNPATAFWTAETERVLRVEGPSSTDLQRDRSADVEPLLATINRNFEAHAKLEGWLRYLAEVDGGEPGLLADLAKHRAEVRAALQECVAGLPLGGAAYQSSWEDFRARYVSYHNLIREHFSAVQLRVATQWDRRTA